MKIVQWSMAIPQKHHQDFIAWFKDVAAPVFQKFGALKHELHRVHDTALVGRQTIEANGFIERVYFPDDFNIENYFKNVKEDPQAQELSRSYESRFEAGNIRLRILHEA